MAEAEPHELRAYLLGQLSDEEAEQIESRLLTEPEFQEEYDMVVNEITDDYVAGRLEGKELHQVEDYFFKSSARREKLGFALALKQRAKEPVSQKIVEKSRRWPYLAIAAALLIAVGGGVYIWRLMSRNAEVNSGLVALQAAYRNERPFESRISSFNYAPYVATRGPSDNANIDQDELRLAELKLLEARNKNPTPASQYALGKVYLAQKHFAKAIEQFDQALKGDPKNAQLCSDLGAAWLEKGRIDVDKGTVDPTSGLSGKGIEELGRSLENLKKALDLNPNLLEALFNQPLCEEQLTLYLQAEDDWNKYLQRDSTSTWANEARVALQRVKSLKNSASRTREQRRQDFESAYESKNDDSAWSALSVSRSRTGNFIVEALLDDYLHFNSTSETTNARNKLAQLAYVGTLERNRAGDVYTADLAHFYTAVTPARNENLIKARGLMRSGTEYYNRGEFDDASLLFSEARDRFKVENDECEILFSESWIGYCKIRNLNAAEASEFELTRKLEAHHYLSLLAQALQALADAKFNVNQLSTAAEYSKRALRISKTIADGVTTVRCQIQLLSTYLALSDFERSLEFFGNAMRSAENLPPDAKLIWPAYNDAAMTFQLLGLPSTAVEVELEALRLANDADVALLRSRSLERLGLLYSEQNNYEKAIQSGERALAEAKTISSRRARTNILAHSTLLLGQFNTRAGKAREALEYFDRSLNLYRELNSSLYLYEAHKGKLLANIQLKDETATRSELSVAIELFEQNRERIVEESNRNKFFDAGQKIYDIAVDFTWKTDTAKAFDYAEQSRARALFEMMNAGFSIADDGGSPEVRLRSQTKPLSRTEIQARLPDRAQLLEYAVLDDRLVMWLVNDSAIKSEEKLVGAGDLERLTHHFVESLAQPSQANRTDILQVSKELYDDLIAPVEKYLDRSRVLCVIPDKSLNYLPFEALISNASGRYLIEDYEVERAPSATIFIASSEQAKNRERSTNEKLLSVGNPSFDRDEFGSLPDMPEAVREANQIAALYQPEILLTGMAATADRVKEALVNADVIHLATHAVADERSPLLSKLLMAKTTTNAAKKETGDVLRAAEIYELRLPRARVVVLSACRTAVERTYRGEGAVSLSRPFLAAGVPIVIASLWAVDSDVAAELMISFHKHRKQDPDQISTVEALRRAQLDMIHKPQPNSQETFGWAAFTAIGGYAAF